MCECKKSNLCDGVADAADDAGHWARALSSRAQTTRKLRSLPMLPRQHLESWFLIRNAMLWSARLSSLVAVARIAKNSES